ncbi:MAG: response regulator transcription factor [Nitrospiraceae bacterium]|jgi:DNA-binding NarL/FixJ family response regulator
MTPELPQAVERLTRVLIVDDFSAFREGARSLLEENPGIEVVGEAEDGLTATQLAETLRPDIVLMDVHISRVDGVTATRLIKALLPRTAIIGLSAIPTPDIAAAMRQAGARGLIPKGQIYSQLLPAIHDAISERPPPPFAEKE